MFCVVRFDGKCLTPTRRVSEPPCVSVKEVGVAEQRCAFAGCVKLFEPTKAWHRYCSAKCKNDHNNGRRNAALRMYDAAMAAPLALAGCVSTGAST